MNLPEPGFESAAIKRSDHSIALQLLGLFVLLALPSSYYDTAVWSLPRRAQTIIACFCVSYLLTLGASSWQQRTGRPLTAVALLRLVTLCYAPALLVLLLIKTDFPRRVMIAEIAVGATFASFIWWEPRFRWHRAMILVSGALLAIAAQVAYHFGALPGEAPPGVEAHPLNTALYSLSVTEYRSWIPKTGVNGGGITRIGDRYVLATGSGELYFVAEAQRDAALKIVTLPYRVPINADDFIADIGNQVDTTRFRVADVLAQQHGGRVVVFASHHYWHRERQCFGLRVSSLEGTMEELQQKDTLKWATVYESAPCLAVVAPGRPAFFGGHETGGRLALLDEHRLLLTVGDNALDGWGVPSSEPQVPDSDYGKTILIDLAAHSHEIYTTGHRNPQGLFAAADGRIWSTEHGPQGGDELNLLERGANYGYPLVTYGVQYGTHKWPFDAIPGGHDGYAEPFYSWVPSIGVSNLLVSNSQMFKWWQGDLLITSLRGKTLYRMRVRKDRIVMAETIHIGERIRDIEEGKDGELVLWCDDQSIRFIRVATDRKSGEALFDSCAGCHAIHDGETHGIGPDLYNILGRKVASARGFRYSPALQTLPGNWSRERLDDFLKNPAAAVPGTAMQFSGMPEKASRTLLLDFLSSGQQRDIGELIYTE